MINETETVTTRHIPSRIKPRQEPSEGGRTERERERVRERKREVDRELDRQKPSMKNKNRNKTESKKKKNHPLRDGVSQLTVGVYRESPTGRIHMVSHNTSAHHKPSQPKTSPKTGLQTHTHN